MLVEGCSLGSISMTCYTLGAAGADVSAARAGADVTAQGAGAASLPDPSIVPAEDTNT